MSASRRQQKQIERTHTTVELREGVQERSLQLRAGPLPAPGEFEGYERVLPGAAERLLAMAEREQQHRHELEVRQTTHDQQLERKGLAYGASLTAAGMIVGLIALLSILLTGAWLLRQGYEVAGYAALVAAATTVIGVFVRGTILRKQDQKKSE